MNGKNNGNYIFFQKTLHDVEEAKRELNYEVGTLISPDGKIINEYGGEGGYLGMILNRLIDGVRYPDEIDGLYFDATPYDEVVDFLQFSISASDGQLKMDMQETLTELERRLKERHSKSKRIEIPVRKVRNTV